MNTQNYTVTPDEYQAMQAQLTTQSGTVTVQFNSGRLSGTIVDQGVILNFSYDGTSQLTVTISSKPFWVPTSMVWSELSSFLPKPML